MSAAALDGGNINLAGAGGGAGYQAAAPLCPVVSCSSGDLLAIRENNPDSTTSRNTDRAIRMPEGRALQLGEVTHIKVIRAE